MEIVPSSAQQGVCFSCSSRTGASICQDCADDIADVLVELKIYINRYYMRYSIWKQWK